MLVETARLEKRSPVALAGAALAKDSAVVLVPWQQLIHVVKTAQLRVLSDLRIPTQ